jgi:hypothetical protein
MYKNNHHEANAVQCSSMHGRVVNVMHKYKDVKQGTVPPPSAVHPSPAAVELLLLLVLLAAPAPPRASAPAADHHGSSAIASPSRLAPRHA